MAGYLEVHDGEPRRFAIPAGHAEALTDHLSLGYVAPFARMISAAGAKLGDIVEVHRDGAGVSWEAFGHDMRESQGDMNRPFFLNLLAQEWFGGVEHIHRRLRAGGRVADIGCGHGWSAVALALGYPGLEVDGFDLDEPSITAAERHASEHEVVDRVAVPRSGRSRHFRTRSSTPRWSAQRPRAGRPGVLRSPPRCMASRNEGGTWRGTRQVVEARETIPWQGNFCVVLSGEGGYEGLTAAIFYGQDDTAMGAILPRPIPEPIEPDPH